MFRVGVGRREGSGWGGGLAALVVDSNLPFVTQVVAPVSVYHLGGGVGAFELTEYFVVV